MLLLVTQGQVNNSLAFVFLGTVRYVERSDFCSIWKQKKMLHELRPIVQWLPMDVSQGEGRRREPSPSTADTADWWEEGHSPRLQLACECCIVRCCHSTANAKNKTSPDMLRVQILHSAKHFSNFSTCSHATCPHARTPNCRHYPTYPCFDGQAGRAKSI